MSSTLTGRLAAIERPGVPCPICGTPNKTGITCPHQRWTFNRGGPLDFARFALETSPYIRNGGHDARQITTAWLEAHGDWIVDRVLSRLQAIDGYVFGELNDIDHIARDIWKAFSPDPNRPALQRIDPS
jgi:hypothetical protein